MGVLKCPACRYWYAANTATTNIVTYTVYNKYRHLIHPCHKHMSSTQMSLDVMPYLHALCPTWEDNGIAYDNNRSIYSGVVAIVRATPPPNALTAWAMGLPALSGRSITRTNNHVFVVPRGIVAGIRLWLCVGWGFLRLAAWSPLKERKRRTKAW